ncbi:MAG: 16S rRNA (cytidine(1402)-2'-O)-methyltransferase, partial [bacterium]
MSTSSKNSLFVVATPIGNLQDLSFRALLTFKNSSLFLAEDTR